MISYFRPEGLSRHVEFGPASRWVPTTVMARSVQEEYAQLLLPTFLPWSSPSSSKTRQNVVAEAICDGLDEWANALMRGPHKKNYDTRYQYQVSVLKP